MEVPRRPERKVKSWFLVPVGIDFAAARERELEELASSHAAQSEPSGSQRPKDMIRSPPAAIIPPEPDRVRAKEISVPGHKPAPAPSLPSAWAAGGGAKRKRTVQEVGGGRADGCGTGGSAAQGAIDLTESPPPSPRAVAARQALRRARVREREVGGVAKGQMPRAPAEAVISLCSSDEESCET